MAVYPSRSRSLLIRLCLCALSACLLPTCIKAQERSESGFLRNSHTLAERWELGRENDKGLFLITPYRPVYITAGRWSDSPNEQPVSENPAYSLPFRIPYNHFEAKFQFSFKTKVAHRIFGDNGDIWLAFTQQANWQVYNERLSRPFRELNYEPELIINFKTNYKLLGLNGRMLGVIFNHQSNGKSLPLSRSWNRLILQVAFDAGNWQVILRPWVRLGDKEDENPAIIDYVGKGEAIVVFNAGKHQLSSIMRHSLNFNNGGKGSVQLSWAFPVVNNLRGLLQISNGYGETLLDYNHRQTTIGVSASLTDW